MSKVQDAKEAYQRARFMRPDAARFIRPDVLQFQPGTDVEAVFPALDHKYSSSTGRLARPADHRQHGGTILQWGRPP